MKTQAVIKVVGNPNDVVARIRKILDDGYTVEEHMISMPPSGQPFGAITVIIIAGKTEIL